MNVHDLTIDPACSALLVKGNPVSLGRTEFRILHFLARHPGCTFTRDQIITGVRGEDYPVTARTIDVQIVGLRKKLGSSRKYIETVRGVGYRFRQ